MPTREHEAPLLLLREHPELVAELLRDLLGVAVPAHTEARIEQADFTQVFPAAFRADLVMTLRQGGRPVMGIVGEIQRGEDPDKRASWPLYNAALHAQLRCQIVLVVLAETEAIARWARKPIETVQVGSPFTPLVIGPSDIPVVTSEDQARATLELAILSALVHGKTQRGLEVGRSAARATVSLALPEPRRTLYLDLVLSALHAGDRAILEFEMDLTGYKFKSETYKRLMAEDIAEATEKGIEKGQATGQAKAVVAVLEARQIQVPDDARDRILACSDLAVLERWVRRAVTVASVDELFRDA
ncbi:hypothetical protein [Pendulispora albinea]|uniref:Uncharacterized protein n=1 Tax=Pendulispora albinea TaxID=2741071 RepID=A0ABZ2LRL3_9BACT